MARRRAYTTSRARKTSRKVRESTVGTHVARSGSRPRRSNGFADDIRIRARARRIATGVIAVIVVVGVALMAAWVAFRGTVGSEMSLKGSDANEALVAAKSGEPTYTLVAIELGAVAQPLETEGPDMLLLVRADGQRESLAVIDIPGSLRVVDDNVSTNIASIASRGDAALIDAVASFSKVDISHLVKVDQDGLTSMVDALGGVEVDIDQVIDDPHASNVYLAAGKTTLDSSNVLAYLRADNLKLGVQDKLTHQLDFCAALIEKLFMASGNFQAKIESIDSYFQTDCALSDFERLASWLGHETIEDVVMASLPGYMTSVTGIGEDQGERYVGASSDMAAIIEALEEGKTPAASGAKAAGTVSPSSFTVDVQNGTSIAGAAAVTGDMLKEKGFNVGSVGNAEQQIYEETLVVYRDGGEALANTVIDAVGAGRAVDASAYYSFDADVLLVIGSDYAPVA